MLLRELISSSEDYEFDEGVTTIFGKSGNKTVRSIVAQADHVKDELLQSLQLVMLLRT